jgi:transporter family-2 protein
MNTQWVWLFVAMFAGVNAALQSSTNGGLAKKIGLSASMTVNTLVFTGIALIYLLVESLLKRVPWDGFKQMTFLEGLGGVFGFLLVFSLMLTFPRLGALYSLVLMILGQCVMALIIDQYGLFGMPQSVATWPRLTGVGLIIAGVFLMNR